MPNPARIYHNPRCSKSRAALALLQEAGVEVEIIEYLKHPPTRETLTELVAMLGVEAPTLLRRSESVFREHYAGVEITADVAMDALLAHPILLERPIVVLRTRAVVGRPPERVLELL